MIPVLKQMRRACLAVVALGSIGISGQAFAQNTTSGDTISNTATVNYSVGTVTQTPITASTSFLVDTVIRFNLTGGASINVTPGSTNRLQVFTLTNTSNITSLFAFTGTNQAGDQFDMNSPGTTTAGVAVYTDVNADGLLDAGDTLVSAPVSFNRNQSRQYLIVADTPIGATDGQQAIVRLAAEARNPVGGAVWAANTADADLPNTVQIVVGNTAANAQGTFVVATATLAVAKSSSVVRDPFSASNPKAIPGAVMQYQISVANTGSQAATLQNVSDPIPAATAILRGDYAGATDVQIQVGVGAPTYCLAEAGADSNSDGCYVTAGGALTVGAPAVTSVAAGTTVFVRFRVTIQ